MNARVTQTPIFLYLSKHTKTQVRVCALVFKFLSLEPESARGKNAYVTHNILQ